jgi:hypothetical protein
MLDLWTFDPFQAFRWLLAVACTIYAVVQIGRTLMRWTEFLWADAPHRRIMRRYAAVQLLRLRIRRFSGELMRIAVLAVVAGILIWLHAYLGYVGH